jgi:hypothetical protein
MASSYGDQGLTPSLGYFHVVGWVGPRMLPDGRAPPGTRHPDTMVEYIYRVKFHLIDIMYIAYNSQPTHLIARRPQPTHLRREGGLVSS